MLTTEKTEFKTGLKSDIKKSEKKLKKLLEDKSKGIFNTLKEIEKFAVNNQPSGTDYDVQAYKEKLWENIAKQWSETLSEQIIEYMHKELVDSLSDRMFIVLDKINNKIKF